MNIPKSNLITSDFPENEAVFVYAQLIHLLVRQKWSIFFGSLLVCLAMFSIGVQQSTLHLWLAWLVLVVFGLFFHIKFRKMPEVGDFFNIQLQLKRNITVLFFRGIIQGSGLLFFFTMSDAEREITTIIIFGVSVGAIATNAGYAKLYWAFIAPQIFLLAMLWIVVPGQTYAYEHGVFVGVLVLIILIPMFRIYAKSSWGLFEESCRLRFRERVLNVQLQEALSLAEQANRAKNRFLAAASHDLRQPLHVIGFIGSALRLRQLDDKATEMVNLLNKASSSLQSLLNSLLDVSKLDSGLLEVQREAVSIRLVVEEFYQAYSPLVFAKGLTPKLKFSADSNQLLWTVTDAVLLLRILNNLGQNALKFTSVGEISLNVSSSNSDVVIEIKDSGCGIAVEHQEEIFHEFFQVGNHERDVSQGLGLGLSIVRRVADLLNIKVALTSTEGQGTLVRLHIPIVQPSNHQISDSKKNESIDENNKNQIIHNHLGLKILVIDDEVLVLESSRLLLEQLGCTCWIAENIEEARGHLHAMKPARPDLMMVDFRLKGTNNGIDVIHLLSQELGDPPIKAIIISGDTEPERLLMAKEAGINICHKPLTLDKLNDELKGLRGHFL